MFCLFKIGHSSQIKYYNGHCFYRWMSTNCAPLTGQGVFWVWTSSGWMTARRQAFDVIHVIRPYSRNYFKSSRPNTADAIKRSNNESALHPESSDITTKSSATLVLLISISILCCFFCLCSLLGLIGRFHKSRPLTLEKRQFACQQTSDYPADSKCGDTMWIPKRELFIFGASVAHFTKTKMHLWRRHTNSEPL